MPPAVLVSCRHFAGSCRPGVARGRWLQTKNFKVLSETLSVTVGPGRLRPVLFVHGNSSCAAVWRNQLAAVNQQGHAVIAPDLPGHGRSANSPTPGDTYSFPGYAAVLSALLDRLGIASVTVVGWSLGGHVGLEFMATDRRVNALLIFGTPPVPLCQAALAEAFYPTASMNLAGKPDFSEAEALAYGTATLGGRQQLTADLLAGIRRTDGAARQMLFVSALAGVGVNQRRLVDSSLEPLCVVHGQHEPFVRLSYLRSLNYRRLWKNRIFVIPGAGHAPHWQRPGLFNAVLSEFLACPQSRQYDGNLPLQV